MISIVGESHGYILESRGDNSTKKNSHENSKVVLNVINEAWKIRFLWISRREKAWDTNGIDSGSERSYEEKGDKKQGKHAAVAEPHVESGKNSLPGTQSWNKSKNEVCTEAEGKIVFWKTFCVDCIRYIVYPQITPRPRYIIILQQKERVNEPGKITLPVPHV